MSEPRNGIPYSQEKQTSENENRVRRTNMDISDIDETKKKKLKTRCYYTDYVNHAIRFYLSTPETLKLDGKRRADVENWMSVQAVFHCLKDEDRQMIETIYKSNYRVANGVKEYCETNKVSERKAWILITKVGAAIARRRGLI